LIDFSPFSAFVGIERGRPDQQATVRFVGLGNPVQYQQRRKTPPLKGKINNIFLHSIQKIMKINQLFGIRIYVFLGLILCFSPVVAQFSDKITTQNLEPQVTSSNQKMLQPEGYMIINENTQKSIPHAESAVNNGLSMVWEKIPGALTQISVGRDGLVWGVNRKEEIFKYKGAGQWEQIGGNLTNVSVNADGSVWGVNGSDQIFRWKGTGWTAINEIGGNLRQISVGRNRNIWGVNRQQEIFRYKSGAGWEPIGGNLTNVSVGADGTVWGVNVSDQIFRWKGAQWTAIDEIGGNLTQISVGSADHIWGVNRQQLIFRYVNGTGWEQVAGSLKWVSVASDGTVWGVNDKDEIYHLIYK
jgi:virginiamycin B lyase